MPNDNQTTSESPSCDAACSPFVDDTPVTTALMLANGRAIARCETRPPIWETMRKLERERNEAIHLAESLEGGLREHGWTIVKMKQQIEDLANYINGIADDADGCGDETLANQMRRFVDDTISENVKEHAPPLARASVDHWVRVGII